MMVVMLVMVLVATVMIIILMMIVLVVADVLCCIAVVLSARTMYPDKGYRAARTRIYQLTVTHRVKFSPGVPR